MGGVSPVSQMLRTLGDPGKWKPTVGSALPGAITQNYYRSDDILAFVYINTQYLM